MQLLESAWTAANDVAGLIPNTAYFSMAVRFTLAMEMLYCSSYVYVAIRQFKYPAMIPAKKTDKVPGYVTQPTVKGDVQFAAERGQNYRHVSEFSGASSPAPPTRTSPTASSRSCSGRGRRPTRRGKCFTAWASPSSASSPSRA